MTSKTEHPPTTHHAAMSLALLGITGVLAQELVKSGAVDAQRLSLALGELSDAVGAEQTTADERTFEQRVIAIVRNTVDAAAKLKDKTTP